ncbi:MAG: relaxase/mobilization nuclease domain-containing protein [Cyanobacteriota bacterium]|nr:relaxase/mobilization nuclease domain-containing protein [Cyanobacteriota bacterium]
MIGHIETGEDFGGLFRYLLDPAKKPRIIGGNAAGERPEELTPEFNNCADQRRTVKKPVKHLMVSFAPEDGEVSDETKAQIADAVVEGLGYTDNQYIVIDHHRDDPGHDWNHDHDHIHIVANAITITGQRTRDSWEKYRMQEILRELEIAHNLALCASSWEKSRRSPSHGQVQRYKKEQKQYEAGERDAPPEQPVSEKLQDLIERASRDRPTMSEFIGRLQQQGVEVRARITRNSVVQGMSFRLEGVKFPGHRLGDASFPKLVQKRGVRYEAHRDLTPRSSTPCSKPISISWMNF